MTRKTVAPALVSLAALLALGGCGGNEGLSAYGRAVVTIGSTPTGFDFGTGVRLDGGHGTTASCQISRGTGTGAYGVVIDLIGNPAAEGRAIRSMTVLAHSDAPDTGSVSASLGGTDFEGTCRVVVTELDEGTGSVRLSATDCAIQSTTESASALIDFGMRGCTVM